MDDIPYHSMNTAARERYWQKLLEKWQAGGLSRKAFCDQEKISRSTLTYWRKRCQGRPGPIDAAATPTALDLSTSSSGFVEVRPARTSAQTPTRSATRGAYTVRLRGGRSIQLATGFDENDVGRLVRLLEALC